MPGNEIRVEAAGLDIPGEIAECLGLGGCRLTLGGFMRLVAAGSPYVFGGEVTPSQLETAARICGVSGRPGAHAAVCRAIEHALGVFGLVAPDTAAPGMPLPPPRRGSDRPPFGPEWLADLAAAAMAAAPGLSWHDLMEGIPLMMAAHLALADHRRNGGRTERRSEEAEQKALAALRERRRQREQEARPNGRKKA